MSKPLRAWCMVCHDWQPLDHTSEECAQAVHEGRALAAVLDTDMEDDLP